MCKKLSIKKIGGIFYIKGKGLWKGHCSICGKRRKVTAHHLIPRRAKKICSNKALRELRISICKKCEDEIHPENLLINESPIIKSQQGHINNLEKSIARGDIKIEMLKKMLHLLKRQCHSGIDHILSGLDLNTDGRKEKRDAKILMKGGKETKNGKKDIIIKNRPS